MNPQSNGSFPPRRLNERDIEKLKYTGKPFAVRDTKVRGFMVAVNKHTKSFKIQHDLRRNGRKVKTVRRTLGRVDHLTLNQARTMAMELLAQVRAGVDPNLADRPNTGLWTVEDMFREHMKDLRIRKRAPRTIADAGALLNRYLADWKQLPIDQVTRKMARDRHALITENNGPVVANHALQSFGTAYRFALRVLDEELPVNPITAVTYNPQRPKRDAVAFEDLPNWYARVQELSNPVRRDMYLLGLFSGLRPGTLASLRLEWINLDKQVIHIPHMKSGEPFDLPLSENMVQIVRRAMKAGDVLHAGSPWLFPTRGADGRITHAKVMKEKTLGKAVGHTLRRTYRTICDHVGLTQEDARKLMHHKLPGIDSVYVVNRLLFDRLLQAQERMSAAILELLDR